MLSGLLVSLAVNMLGVAWTWNVFVGAVATFGVGISVSAITREKQPGPAQAPAA
jgi:hypothetical protein